MGAMNNQESVISLIVRILVKRFEMLCKSKDWQNSEWMMSTRKHWSANEHVPMWNRGSTTCAGKLIRQD